MGTEKFFVFNESGTLKRLKGRIVRFLDNEDPDNTDKVNIRASISVPASAEGLTPANNLSDVSSVATSRDNLSVPSDDEVAEGLGTKLVGPALFFRVNDYIEFADSGKWSFVSATDDLPVTLEGFLSIDELPSVRYTIAAKYGLVSTEYEYWLFIDSSGYVNFRISDTSGNYEQGQTTASVPVGSRFHLAVTYGGSGPNSGTAFTGAFSEMSIWFNGVLQTIADVSSGTYTGMSDTSEPFAIGRRNGADYLTGHISSIRVHNRELSAAEITDYMNGEINFSDEYAGAEVYSGDSSTFTSSLGNWTEEGSTSITVAQSGGEMVITNTASSSGTRGARNVVDAYTNGKRHRVKFIVRTSSGTGQQILLRSFNGAEVKNVTVIQGGGAAGSVGNSTVYTFTPGASNEVHEIEFTTTGSGASDYLFFSLNNTGAGEVYNVDNVTLTQVGILADLRAEDFNESAGKLMDRSSNNFVGVNNGATLVGKRRHISAATINLTNLPTSSAGLSAGEVWSNSGVLTIV